MRRSCRANSPWPATGAARPPCPIGATPQARRPDDEAAHCTGAQGSYPQRIRPLPSLRAARIQHGHAHFVEAHAHTRTSGTADDKTKFWGLRIVCGKPVDKPVHAVNKAWKSPSAPTRAAKRRSTRSAAFDASRCIASNTGLFSARVRKQKKSPRLSCRCSAGTAPQRRTRTSTRSSAWMRGDRLRICHGNQTHLPAVRRQT